MSVSSDITAAAGEATSAAIAMRVAAKALDAMKSQGQAVTDMLQDAARLADDIAHDRRLANLPHQGALLDTLA